MPSERIPVGSCFAGGTRGAEIPHNAYRMLTPDTSIRVYASQRYKSKPTGWSFPSGPMSGPDGYILLSRYNGTEKRHKIELVSLPAMRTVHSWSLNAGQILKDVTHVSRFADHHAWDNEHFRQIHPWLEENGDLIVKDHNSPLFRIGPCGNRLWMLQDAVYHHSTEADAKAICGFLPSPNGTASRMSKTVSVITRSAKSAPRANCSIPNR